MNPPSLSELLEATLRVPFSATEIFGQLRDSPRPGFGAMTANLLFWTALGLLLNVVSTMVRLPDAAGLGTLPMAVGLGAALLLALPASFVAALILHLLARLSGGREDFGRSFQILSLLGAIAPLSAVVLWLPSWAWIAPTLYATLLAVRGVSLMHYAPVLQAWIIFGTAGLLLSAGQLAARASISRLQQHMEAAMNLYGNPPAPGARPPAPGDPGPGEAPAPSSWLPPVRETAQSLEGSGMGMVHRPEEGASGLPSGVVPGQGTLPSDQQLQQMQDMSLQMLRQANDKVQQPGALDNLPPGQAQQIQELLRMANQAGQQLQRSGKLSGNPQETQQFINQMMRTLQSIQGGAQGVPQVQDGTRPRVQEPKIKGRTRKRKRQAPPAADEL